ncbi:helix-turn-helix domain-containing protein [Saccharothrix syringae]|uniref:XRE family transcriptional regulator n=1 Tax=Saccharothrix syringae TaxID=103733 RepID=A0A5Q0H8Q6_SACSY|nr:helix-turn-helix transcriptional regulator [Saccharothrix syringae]QFZ22608.1 XRE family transcriptional regulator [Saccharothrix syringae]
MTVLLREAIGDRLRHARTTQRRTLREVSRTARVSLGYLSEVERGRKEASSELLAAICEALDLPLSELLHLVASDIGAVQQPVTSPAELTERPAPAAAGLDGAGLDGLEGGAIVPAVIGNDLSDLRLQPVLSHRLSTSIAKPRGAVVAA